MVELQRLLQATSHEYASLGVRRSIAALGPRVSIARAVSGLGKPISFDEVSIDGVIGGGLADCTAGASRRELRATVTC
jgi:PiT family inorganic phosphate transporter